MKNMDRYRWLELTAWAGFALAMSVAPGLHAHAAECPREDALGTSRIIAVDAAATPRVGSRNFLQDREVVLTFDDGPSPATDDRILAALAEQCVRATFFLIGRPASEHPDLVRRIAAAGHSIGHHTWSHHNLRQLKLEDATDEIDKGIAAVENALHGVSTKIPSTPFFRFPGFQMNQQTLDALEKRRIVVFGADVIANDWIPMTQEAQLKLLTDRLKAAGKGIILLHDPEAQTAAVLPDFLRYLRDNRYRVVHVVSAALAAAAAEGRQSEKRE
ncbi:polysaccharide deacetylase family protein [Bradyrhizobium sp.]|uniref:polysaccharide deacetylase family protein n=1 Tax=Bradyrhizobium sp. TaxID=376 RepID=UPI001D3F94DD|nr:polysaccharide deacetylase family protein [Bradyrhizobium sp.]MBI5318269.1 polysaccharide deacetylase family protein [Bradyrhizobium sp.]